MGVDYSTTIGYGFAFEDDNLPPALKALADGDYLGEEHIRPWLAENDLHDIECTTVGNWMNGETQTFLCLRDTYFHRELYDSDGVYKMSKPSLTGADYIQVNKLRELLDIDEFAEWYVSFNVS